jgi:hypothetical protein
MQKGNEGNRMSVTAFISQLRSELEQIEWEIRCLERFDAGASDAAGQFARETESAGTTGFPRVTQSKEE